MISLFLNSMRLLKAIARSWDDPHFRAGLLLCFVTLLSGTVFYSSVEGWSWVDALYFSATTLSTVGFGDLSPATQIGKIFTVIYVFVGVGIFIALFIQFAKALLQDQD
ncbi:potassium channel family protein [Ruegeria profundi]|uniref:potassium channel family protein n=1 Tax=Ruegeria profundi TaxID=1685378 RepID=UPI001CD22632|nr:potassium channel family protein [Ruegeria profundi]MCA0930460.1 potassium channel family protein [Ruegeria profundi]